MAFPSSVAARKFADGASILVNIQALRAIAAFLVVFVHLQPLVNRLGADPNLFDFGNGGVDLFFVISGVIMVYTTRARETTALNFIAHRIARIVPFYWFMTFAVFGIALVAPSLLQATRADWADLLRSLAFMPFRRANGFVQPIVFVGWTLNYEMVFYLLFAAGMLTGRRFWGLAATFTILLVAALAGLMLRPQGLYAPFYLAPIVLEFGLGMILGSAIPLLPRDRAMIPAAAILGAGCFVLLIVGPDLWPSTDRLFVFGLPAFGLVAAALMLEASGAIVRMPLLKSLGDASYAIYLTHFFVTQTAVKVAEILGVAAPTPIVLLCFASFPAVAATGLIVHRAIERPLSTAARRLFFGRRRIPQSETILAALRSHG